VELAGEEAIENISDMTSSAAGTDSSGIGVPSQAGSGHAQCSPTWQRARPVPQQNAQDGGGHPAMDRGAAQGNLQQQGGDAFARPGAPDVGGDGQGMDIDDEHDQNSQA